MKNRVIYFDFDRTLLDTNALKVEQTKRIAKISNLLEEQVNEGMRKYVDSIHDHLTFTPEGFAVFLEEMYGVPPSEVLKIYITDSNYIADFLFPESLEVLRELRDRGNSLGIFSAAMPGPQRLKIDRTGVLEFIDEKLVIIDPEKLGIEALEKLPDGVVIVDDDSSVIRKLARHMPRFVPIWCNRVTEEVIPQVRTIQNLQQLLEIE